MNGPLISIELELLFYLVSKVVTRNASMEPCGALMTPVLYPNWENEFNKLTFLVIFYEIEYFITMTKKITNSSILLNWYLEHAQNGREDSQAKSPTHFSLVYWPRIFINVHK